MKSLFWKIGAVAAGVTLTCCLFGCSFTLTSGTSTDESSQTNQEDVILKVGDSFSSDGVEYTINSIAYNTNLYGNGFVYIDYTGVNTSDEPVTIGEMPGSLYNPEGKGVSEESLLPLSLSSFSSTTNDALPGAAIDGISAWEIAGSGDYTFLIDEMDFHGSLVFTLELPESGSGEGSITYETGGGTESYSFSV